MSRPIVMTSLAGAVIAIALAVPYAAALVYTPSAYVGVILPALLGTLIGGLVAAIGRRWQVRDARWLVRIGVASAMAGYGLSWIPWEWFTLSHVGREIDVRTVLSPSSFVRLLGVLYESGAWTLGGAPVSGARLGIVWLGEAGIVFGASAFAARASWR